MQLWLDLWKLVLVQLTREEKQWKASTALVRSKAYFFSTPTFVPSLPHSTRLFIVIDIQSRVCYVVNSRLSLLLLECFICAIMYEPRRVVVMMSRWRKVDEGGELARITTENKKKCQEWSVDAKKKKKKLCGKQNIMSSSPLTACSNQPEPGTGEDGAEKTRLSWMCVAFITLNYNFVTGTQIA